MRVGVLCSRIRLEEKLIFGALDRRSLRWERIDEATLACDLAQRSAPWDVVLGRTLSYWNAYYASTWLANAGVRTVNRPEVVHVCGDKLLTTAALAHHGVPVPRTSVAFSPDAALDVIESFGYPVVLKPLVGSWGRLLARINDRDAAEALIEHRQYMRSPQHGVFYVQEYVDKPGRDLRVLVAGDRVLAAIERLADHWITNTARGAKARALILSPEIDALVRRAAVAVGSGLLAVDILERPDGDLVVSEINHSMEFHGAFDATGADIAGGIVDYLVEVARA